MKIGSFLWRAKNYGLKPGISYLVSKISLYERNLLAPILSDADALKIEVGITDPQVNNSAMLKELKTSFEEIKLLLRKPNVKNVFDEPSFTRVLVLGYLIQSNKFRQVIETGTQNGVSTILISRLNKKYEANLSIHSIDVTDQPKIPDEGVNYHVLDQPFRENFCRLTSEINLPSTIFFHDSDHSKENMDFEFDWAWNHLQVSALVSDDIESNSAFADFCRNNSLSPLFFKFDSGPCVGLVLRS
jgi:hypothetical protein